ncbi:hypothetical protein DL764_002793 [Monosporascus ibericus]|uniref:Uncharacterized protein n=1 Tax=Monosporascus ibericus TaxID=155417 RepID=A0A4Q4TLL8_9PEZI|nr:hypothetical protein DL764_002793 [Monosporascus ibericus]
MALAYVSNTIGTRALLGEEVKVSLDADDIGEVKSTVNYRYGEAQGKGYTVAFRRLAETHGNLDIPKLDEDGVPVPVPVDDGSLLALQIIPRTDSRKRRFESLSVKLSLELDPIRGSNQNPPSLVAYEPAADGSEFFQECVTSVKKTSGSEVGAGIQASTFAEGTVKRTWGTEKGFDQRRRLTLSSKSSGLHIGTDTYVTFDLTAASAEDGIGDSLAVALIVKRSPGTSFYIVATSNASVNTRLSDFVPSGWKPGEASRSKSEKHDLSKVVRLGPFGPAPIGAEQICPEGVDAKHLRKASNQVLKGLGWNQVEETLRSSRAARYLPSRPHEQRDIGSWHLSTRIWHSCIRRKRMRSKDYWRWHIRTMALTTLSVFKSRGYVTYIKYLLFKSMLLGATAPSLTLAGMARRPLARLQSEDQIRRSTRPAA